MIILDSNVWIAFFYENDSQHKKAEKIVQELGLFITVPEYVVAEVSSVLCLRASKKVSNDFLENIFNNKNIEILLSDEKFFNDVVIDFKNSESKKLSFIDTALLKLSESYQVITFDKELKKAITKIN